ncbi:MAG TPA: TetR/AcrR family transcriptional regulator [Streptosporangiaceae bacterium]|jgi:AcrR family transcriptional regulator|nr:TetR/AcrR family transcriptional regulator [Streptosporangiaceae bacterium]
MPASAKGGRYHHGDLRAALVDAAIDLIAERGVRAFSLAEASRRIGVSAAAPYRHFADRDDLLAAVAVRSLQVFAAMVAAEADDAPDPRQQLAAMTRAYVRFAAQQRPLFDALYSWGLDKSRYPELQRAWEPVDAFLAVVTEICDGDAVAADALATALEATAHGHAMLLLEDEPDGSAAAVAAAADRAAAATLALIAGRAALAG